MFVREAPLPQDSDYAVEVRAAQGSQEAAEEASRRGLRHQAKSYAQFVRESARHKQQRVTVAGAGVIAANTGRILLIQRSNKDTSDPARGLWELPGGHLDEAESPWDAARREWSEETGIPFPTQGFLAGNWISNNIYAAHLFVIPAENDIDLHPDGQDRVGNPDDPGGDDIEAIAWWEPTHLLKSNRSLRPEFIDGIDRPLLMRVCKDADSGDLVKESALQSRPAEPMDLHWMHNDTPSPPHPDPSAYGRDVEPAGKYLIERPEHHQPQEGWSAGTTSFAKPLHLDFGGGYDHPSNWKRRLSDAYGGKAGHELSDAVRADGYDGIVTHDRHGTSEIVDLR